MCLCACVYMHGMFHSLGVVPIRVSVCACVCVCASQFHTVFFLYLPAEAAFSSCIFTSFKYIFYMHAFSHISEP